MAGDLFAVLVEADVVAAPADEAGVVQGGFAAVFPVADVVDLADFVVGAAADAAAVAGDELFAQPGGDLAFGAAQEGVAGVFVEDARQDLGVTRECEGFGFGEAGVVGEAGVGDLLANLVVVGEDE